jgi:RimJ/RimL family protein N-acetyltransferase
MGYLGLNIAFNKMNMDTVTGYVISFNMASMKYHTHLGFVVTDIQKAQIYRNNTYYDVVTYTLEKEKWNVRKDALNI